MKDVIRGCVLALAIPALATAQSGQNKIEWNLRLNETRGPIRTADVSPLTQGASTEILGGPTNGSENAYLLYTRMAPGARGPALFTLPVEHYYVVVSGKMTVQIGTDTFTAEPMTGVVIPANVPHSVWNADAQPEAHLEAIAPASSRDLLTMVKPAQPRKVDNAAQYIRRIAVPAAKDLKPGLNGQGVHQPCDGKREHGSPRQHHARQRRTRDACSSLRTGVFLRRRFDDHRVWRGQTGRRRKTTS
jgi:mannose-6-phosphate isomerase-like protein (cupin superfamily)